MNIDKFFLRSGFLTRRQWFGACALLTLPAAARDANTAWAETERAARGQTVYFNAWAGSERINAYLQWAGALAQQALGLPTDVPLAPYALERFITGHLLRGRYGSGAVA